MNVISSNFYLNNIYIHHFKNDQIVNYFFVYINYINYVNYVFINIQNILI